MNIRDNELSREETYVFCLTFLEANGIYNTVGETMPPRLEKTYNLVTPLAEDNKGMPSFES